jgi:hypothetical protein
VYMTNEMMKGAANTLGTLNRNKELCQAMSTTSFKESSGYTFKDKVSRTKENICLINNENLSIEQRLKVIKKCMQSPEILSYMPSIKDFFLKHSPKKMGANERVVLAEIQNLDSARALLLSLTDKLNTPIVKLEMATLLPIILDE